MPGHFYYAVVQEDGRELEEDHGRKKRENKNGWDRDGLFGNREGIAYHLRLANSSSRTWHEETKKISNRGGITVQRAGVYGLHHRRTERSREI